MNTLWIQWIHEYMNTWIQEWIHTYITLHYITLHYIALHCIALHCIALHCIALHYITYIHTKNWGIPYVCQTRIKWVTVWLLTRSKWDAHHIAGLRYPAKKRCKLVGRYSCLVSQDSRTELPWTSHAKLGNIYWKLRIKCPTHSIFSRGYTMFKRNKHHLTPTD